MDGSEMQQELRWIAYYNNIWNYLFINTLCLKKSDSR
jgi:hypothetical protein